MYDGDPRCELLRFVTRHNVSVLFVIFTQYCSGDQIEKTEIGGSCSAYGEEEKRIQGFGWENWKKENTWETQA